MASDWHRAVVVDQRRHEALRIVLEVIGADLLALAQVHVVLFRLQPLHVQRDTHAIGGGRAEVGVVLHGDIPGASTIRGQQAWHERERAGNSIAAVSKLGA